MVVADSEKSIPKDITGLNFEDALKELEDIIQALESGDGGLDDAIRSYERGVVLKQHCEAKLQEAKEICLKILNTDNKNYEIYNIFGLINFQLKEYYEAIKNWNTATKLNPQYSFAYNNLGNAYLILKKYNEALKNYNQATIIKNDYFEAFYNKANVLVKLEKFDEALKNYEQSIKIKNDYLPALKNRAFLLKKLRKFDLAIRQWKEIIKLYPKDISSYIQRGDLLSDLNKYEEALNSYNQAYSINSEHPFLFGQIFFTKIKICDWKNFKEVLKDFENRINDLQKVSPPFPILTLFNSPSLQKKSAQIWVNELNKIEPKLTKNVLKIFDLKHSVNSKKSYGGTSFDNIKKMITKYKKT